MCPCLLEFRLCPARRAANGTSRSFAMFGDGTIGGFAKRAHPARARYLNVNLARRNRDLQPGGKEIEGGGRGGGGGGEK